MLAVNTEEAPDYDLCTHKITIPTNITAQDGAILEQTTKVAITGCAAVKAQHQVAQLLAKALKACRKDKRKSQARRLRKGRPQEVRRQGLEEARQDRQKSKQRH